MVKECTHEFLSNVNNNKMNIELKNIKVRDIFNGYVNNDTENGVIGYNGNLNIRPKYQYIFNQEKQIFKILSRISARLRL